MPSLEQLLAGVRGVKELPETATRKSIEHTHSDVFRGAVKQEKSLVKRLNGLVKAVREGKITKETALKSAEEIVTEHQAKMLDVALRRARRTLGKQVTTLSPELTERLNTLKVSTLSSFSQVLSDLRIEESNP